MKKLQLKPQHGRIVHHRYGEITNANLTKEIYDSLVSESEAHKDLFEEADAPEPKKSEEKNKQPKSQSNGTTV